jgi:hypothetical protein
MGLGALFSSGPATHNQTNHKDEPEGNKDAEDYLKALLALLFGQLLG